MENIDYFRIAFYRQIIDISCIYRVSNFNGTKAHAGRRQWALGINRMCVYAIDEMNLNWKLNTKILSGADINVSFIKWHDHGKGIKIMVATYLAEHDSHFMLFSLSNLAAKSKRLVERRRKKKKKRNWTADADCDCANQNKNKKWTYSANISVCLCGNSTKFRFWIRMMVHNI